MQTLIIRLSSLGDVLLTTAVVRGLHAANPEGVIDVCTRPAYVPIFACDPRVRKVVAYDDQNPMSTRDAIRANGSYDCVVDLHNSLRSRGMRFGVAHRTFVVKKRTMARWLLVHTPLNLLRNAPDVIGRYFETVAPLGVVDDGGGPDFFSGAAPLPDDLANALASGTIIGVCPGARHFTKRWPAERFAELCATLVRDQTAGIVLFGGEEDRPVCEAIATSVASAAPQARLVNAAGRLSLPQVALAMDGCSVVVTNDSGSMHLASSRKRPVVAIFGSTVREFGFAPRHGAAIVENAGLECRPCSHIGRASCPKGHFKCMRDISVETVLAAISTRGAVPPVSSKQDYRSTNREMR